MSELLESLLRRDRVIVTGSLVLVAMLAWAWLLAGAGMGMDAFEMTRHSRMDMPWTQPAPWTPLYALLIFSMWWIMMAAMMLPSAAQVILLAAALNRRTAPASRPYGSVTAFTAGYLLAWGGFSALAVLLQWWLMNSGILNAMLASTSERFSGAVLLAAGLWQFSPWKKSCLRHCRSPVSFLVRQRRSGPWGALRMGVRHGTYCLGCCWFLMALLFIGGVMNLYWITGLAIYVWLEKAVPGGSWVPGVLGVALTLSGLWLLV